MDEKKNAVKKPTSEAVVEGKAKTRSTKTATKAGVKKPRAAARRTLRTAAKAPERGALKLLITVVNRPKVEFYMDLLQTFEVNMQMVASARGTASSDILQMMGIEESEKAVIFSIIRADRAAAALAALEKRFATIKRGKGIAYTVPMSGMIGVSAYRFLCNNRQGVQGVETT